MLPKTANLFGVIPHSEILKIIAESAIPFTIIVTMESANNISVIILLPEFFELSAIEKNIIAITPISSILKIKRNSLSLYGSLPV